MINEHAFDIGFETAKEESSLSTMQRNLEEEDQSSRGYTCVLNTDRSS